jgi:phenylacetic acid degradation operon negative regulatory protein
MKNSSPIQKWITRFLQQDPPRAKSVVMTVFGDAITPRGGTVWLGSLIALLAPLGISDRLVRTSVYRLADEGWLEASRSGRRSQYRLTMQGEKRFTRAHQRIYAPQPTSWNGRWTLVMTAPDIISASERTALKKELLWEGFGQIAVGIYAHPGGKDDALAELLARTGTAGKVFVVGAAAMDDVSTRPLTELLAHCWDLEKIKQDYAQFIAHFAPLQTLLAQQSPLDSQQAFAIRTLLIHAFRRVQLHDPQLPAQLLSKDWPGATAYELCRSLYRLCSTQANLHVSATLAAEQDEVPAMAAHYACRFCGIAA